MSNFKGVLFTSGFVLLVIIISYVFPATVEQKPEMSFLAGNYFAWDKNNTAIPGSISVFKNSNEMLDEVCTYWNNTTNIKYIDFRIGGCGQNPDYNIHNVSAYQAIMVKVILISFIYILCMYTLSDDNLINILLISSIAILSISIVFNIAVLSQDGYTNSQKYNLEGKLYTSSVYFNDTKRFDRITGQSRFVQNSCYQFKVWPELILASFDKCEKVITQSNPLKILDMIAVSSSLSFLIGFWVVVFMSIND